MKKEENKKEKKKDFIINLIAGVIITTAVGIGISSLFESNKILAAENQNLRQKNSNLKGRNRVLRDENRKLRKENYEACYHLGKKSVTHFHPRIKK
jgi:flagellar basal body-associated protein FliL